MRRARWLWRVARLVRAGVSLARACAAADLGEELDRVWERAGLNRDV